MRAPISLERNGLRTYQLENSIWYQINKQLPLLMREWCQALEGVCAGLGVIEEIKSLFGCRGLAGRGVFP